MDSYYDFNESAKLISYRKLIHFSDLNDLISKAIVTNFFCKESRDKLLNFYTKILEPISEMFSEKQRFPADGYYAILGHSEVGLALSAVIRALDLPLSDSTLSSDYWAAKQSFDDALIKMIEIVDCLDPKKLCERGIYSQSTFESTFKLSWYDYYYE